MPRGPKGERHHADVCHLLAEKRGSINMAKYRLRAAKRNPDGTFDTPLLDDFIDADTLVEAIEKARNFPAILADPFITGCISLTDENGNTVWKLEI